MKRGGQGDEKVAEREKQQKKKKEKRGNQGKGKKSSWGYFCIFIKI